MCIIASGKRLILRDRLPSDVKSYLHWQTHGEWRLYDAPWENEDVPKTAEDEEASNIINDISEMYDLCGLEEELWEMSRSQAMFIIKTLLDFKEHNRFHNQYNVR